MYDVSNDAANPLLSRIAVQPPRMAGPTQTATNLSRIGMRQRLGANGQRTVEVVPQAVARPMLLAPQLRTVGDIWQEWVEGIGGRVPARLVPSSEGSKAINKDRFSNRKPICELLGDLVRACW